MAVVLALAAASSMVGCKTVYVPNTVNVPLLAQAGELRATADANNLQAAYAVADGFGVMANGHWERSRTDQANTSGEDGQGFLAEAGAGHFRTIGDLLQFEAYGGLGYGSVQHDNWETVNGARNDYHYSIKAWKVFAQPSLGITRDVVDAAVSLRMVGLQPFGVRTTNYPIERLRADELADLDQRTWGFLEPAITLRAGYKWLKAFVQYGYSWKLNDAPLNRNVTFLNVGLHGTLAPRFR